MNLGVCVYVCENNVNGKLREYEQRNIFMLTYSELEEKLRRKNRLLLRMYSDMDTRYCFCYSILWLAINGKHSSNVCDGKYIVIFARQFFFICSGFTQRRLQLFSRTWKLVVEIAVFTLLALKFPLLC